MPATLSRSTATSLLALHGQFTPADLKKAYREASLRCHPDKAGTASTEAFQRIQDAYEVLQRDLRYGVNGEDVSLQAGADDLSWFLSQTIDPLHYSQDRSQWGFPTSYERSTRYAKL